MEIGILLLKQIINMFVLMCIGFVFYKRKMISDQGSKDMGKVLLYLVIPVVVISNFCIARTPEKVTELLHSSLISVIAMAMAVVISHIFFGRRDGVACFSSAFSNAGFIGIPLVTAVLGPQAVFNISVMIVFVNALQWIYGVYVMTGDSSVISPGKILKNPIVLAVAFSLVVFFSGAGAYVPAEVRSLFSIITGLNTPLAMMVSGVYLAQSDLLAMLGKKKTYIVSLFRLVIIPLASLAVIMFMPFGTAEMKLAILIAAAAPVGSNVAIFAQVYGKDYTEAVEQVCLSTILCLVTLPVMITLSASLIGG